MKCLDVDTIKQHIIENPHYIEKILEDAGFYKITSRGDEYRCAFDIDTNPTSVKVNKNHLGSADYGRHISGDIITLVQEKTGYKFRDTLKMICNSVGLDTYNMPKRKQPTLPFGGFFKHIGKNKEKYVQLEILDDNILNEFELMPSRMFYDDGIPIEIQHAYNVGYDVLTERVVIPHWDTMGNLVGVVGRYNQIDTPENIPKYLSIIPFPKSHTLYGFHMNYKNIQDKKIVIVCESEKSVMKLSNMKIKTGLAIGGSYLSDIQIRNIQSTNPNMIILGLDEGLEEDLIVEQAKRLKISNPFFNIMVGYIWDSDNKIIKKGSKAAPMDKSKAEFEYLMRNCIKWV